MKCLTGSFLLLISVLGVGADENATPPLSKTPRRKKQRVLGRKSFRSSISDARSNSSTKESSLLGSTTTSTSFMRGDNQGLVISAQSFSLSSSSSASTSLPGSSLSPHLTNPARTSYRLSATIQSRYPIRQVYFQVTRLGTTNRRSRRSYLGLADPSLGPSFYYVQLAGLDPGLYQWSAKALVRVGSKTRVEYSPGDFTFQVFAPSTDKPTSSPSATAIAKTGAPTGAPIPVTRQQALPLAPSPPPSSSPSSASPPAPTTITTTTTTTNTTSVRYGLQDDCRTVDTTKFNICLDLKSQSGQYESWMDAFALARDRWQTVITDDGGTAVDIRSWFPPGSVATELPPVVDDLYVSCNAVGIDGPGKILGMAGPSVVRKSNGKVQPVGGIMKFDIEDIRLLDDDEWKAVILHELGHVLGIGSLFAKNGLSTGALTSDYYGGTFAEAEWEKLCPGGRLPIETDGSVGTAGCHWDEQCLKGELMTGYLSPNAMQLSRMTIGALKDMGYGVDMNAADEFTRANLGQCGKYCPGHRRNLRDTYDKSKEKVSEQGHLDVLKAAAKELQSRSKDSPSDLPDDFEYIATESITVFLRDYDGVVKDDHVTYAEVQDHIVRTAGNIFNHDPSV